MISKYTKKHLRIVVIAGIEENARLVFICGGTILKKIREGDIFVAAADESDGFKIEPSSRLTVNSTPTELNVGDISVTSSGWTRLVP